MPLVLAVVRSCRVPPALNRALGAVPAGKSSRAATCLSRSSSSTRRFCCSLPTRTAARMRDRPSRPGAPVRRSIGPFARPRPARAATAPAASALWWRARRGGYSASGSAVHSPQTTRRTEGAPCGGRHRPVRGKRRRRLASERATRKDGPCANRRRARSCSHSLGDLRAGAPRVPADSVDGARSPPPPRLGWSFRRSARRPSV